MGIYSLDNVVMSIFSFFVACLRGLLLFSLFTWRVWLIIIALLLLLIFVVLYLYEINGSVCHHVSGFWLFIFSEIIIFGRLLFCCLYFDFKFYFRLSSSLELPFLGCFVLLGSSIIVTSYHHFLGWNYSFIFLMLTLVLGVLFIIIQIVEMNEIRVKLFDTVFHARRLCVVGLHFRHVLLGIVGLLFCLTYGLDNLGYYRCSIVVWYWHFVDYVWLLVYTFVYVC